MKQIVSHINTSSPEFKENRKHHLALEKKLKKLSENVLVGGGPALVKKHHDRGKLTARERIDLLIDPGSQFLELSHFAGHDVYDFTCSSAGVVSGIAKIHNRLCIVVANDATVKGGTYVPMTAKKHLRAQEIALQNKLPCIYLVDSGGAFLPMQSEVFPDRDHFGRIFYNQAQMSAQEIPQIAVVMGSCTAGGAYVPAMADESIIVKGTGTIFLGGPALVKAATGEEVSAEELGGAKVHTSESGVADHLAENDEDALEICRNIVQNLNTPTCGNVASLTPAAPKFNIEELYGIIPQDTTKNPLEIREVIARIVDNSEMHEFKKNFGLTIVCGFAFLNGMQIGIIANNGILFSESAQKAAHFIELCSQRKVPLLFLHNISGFMVGKKYEANGIARHGAKMVMAVSCSAVPKISMVIGGSFGAGNYGMCGRAYSPNFMYMCPHSKISVMGGQQAAEVLTTVKQQQLERKGAKKMTKKQIAEFQNPVLQKYENESNALYSSARLWDDGIVYLSDIRDKLSLSFATTLSQPIANSHFGVFRM